MSAYVTSTLQRHSPARHLPYLLLAPPPPTQVGYWEPAKFVAKLREHKTDRNLLLLKTEMGAGHFSVTGRFERLKEVRAGRGGGPAGVG